MSVESPLPDSRLADEERELRASLKAQLAEKRKTLEILKNKLKAEQEEIVQSRETLNKKKANVDAQAAQLEKIRENIFRETSLRSPYKGPSMSPSLGPMDPLDPLTSPIAYTAPVHRATPSDLVLPKFDLAAISRLPDPPEPKRLAPPPEPKKEAVRGTVSESESSYSPDGAIRESLVDLIMRIFVVDATAEKKSTHEVTITGNITMAELKNVIVTELRLPVKEKEKKEMSSPNGTLGIPSTPNRPSVSKYEIYLFHRENHHNYLSDDSITLHSYGIRAGHHIVYSLDEKKVQYYQDERNRAVSMEDVDVAVNEIIKATPFSLNAAAELQARLDALEAKLWGNSPATPMNTLSRSSLGPRSFQREDSETEVAVKFHGTISKNRVSYSRSKSTRARTSPRPSGVEQKYTNKLPKEARPKGEGCCLIM